MPTLPIPLFTRSYKAADGTVLSDDAYLQYNGFIDALGGVNIRPGEVLGLVTEREDRIDKRNDGLFYWPDKEYFVSVDSGVVSINAIGSTTADGYIALGDTTLLGVHTDRAPTFNTGLPVIFASDGTNVFMAAGESMYYVIADGTVTQITDTDAPLLVTHVAYLDGYILAISENKLYWSDIPTTTSWSALSFASAEANPDNIKAMHVVQRQIYLLGTITTEIWENDGESPFSRIPGGVIEIGCVAPYSAIKHGNSLIWLSDTRQFVQFTGTEVKFISSRYDKEIAKFLVVDDCIGGYVTFGGQEFCIFSFPTEERTLVYNPAIDDWSEWRTWDSTRQEWTAYDFRATAKDPTTGIVFIGKRDAGILAAMNPAADSREDVIDVEIDPDTDEAVAVTTPFKFMRQTGFIDHGTSQKKRIEALRFRAKRGTVADDSEPILMLRYRNDGKSDWSNIKEISLGVKGKTDHHIELKRLGICKSRQWEISTTDNIELVLSHAEAEVTVLR